jgi:hypothetical protein
LTGAADSPDMLAALKRVLLPRAARARRIPFGPAAGVVMDIDFAHQARMFLGLYESELNAHFRRLVRTGTRCFDVGTNVGYHSLMFAKLSRRPVVAFEPDPEAVVRLRANLALNPFEVRVVAQAVGPDDSPAGAGTVSLDRAAREHFVPDFVKMDIEGAEAVALAGACELLATRKPHWVVETHGRAVHDQCLALFREHGYRPVAIRPRRIWPELRPGTTGWLVCEGRP